MGFSDGNDYGPNLGGMPALDSATPTGEGYFSTEQQFATPSFGSDSWGFSNEQQQLLSGVADAGYGLGQDWAIADIITSFVSGDLGDARFGQEFPSAVDALNPPGQTNAGPMTSMWNDFKTGASDFWKTINDPTNEKGVTFAWNFLNSMLSRPMRERQMRAYEKRANASMLSAQTDANALALQQQKLENASSIKNTNFGQIQTPKFQDLLAPRRARNTGLIDAEV